MNSEALILDEEAEKLFRELGGVDTSRRTTTSSESAALLCENDDALDQLRLSLMDLVYRISVYFKDSRFLEGVKDTEKESFAAVAEALKKLETIGQGESSVQIRFRGFPSDAKSPAKSDYVITFGKTSVDLLSATAMSRRMGLQYSHLARQLEQSFSILFSNGVNTLHIELPELNNLLSLDHFRTALSIAARFNSSVKRNTPLVFERNGMSVLLPVISDEKGLPDINLTLTAGLNGLDAKAMQHLIRKVDDVMQHSSHLLSPESLTSVYNAIFGIPSLQHKLIKPPIEINNIKWKLMEGGQQPITREQADVTRMVIQKFERAPRLADMAIQSIYGNDYRKINAQKLGERVKLTSHLLSSMDDAPDTAIQKEILTNIRDRVKEVSESVLENMQVRKTEVRFRIGEEEIRIPDVPLNLLKILGFYKRRSGIRTKIKKIARQMIDFDAQDYEVLARDFDIPVSDAKDLITLLKSCFDSQGHFLRKEFEKHIPEFAWYEEKVFEFLWFYLKEIPYRTDRVGFLNAFQLLIHKMKKPANAIQLLLSDVLDRPEEVHYSDRNAFMLMNLLVRTYNKEINLDIEMTPEEVLLVQNGLNQTAISSAGQLIEKERDRLIMKIETIHERLIQAAQTGIVRPDSMPLRFLMALEREASIFLSLVGGSISKSIIRGAIAQYGDPAAVMYHSRLNGTAALLALQNFRVLIRCLYRMLDTSDSLLLDTIRERENAFFRMASSPAYEEKIRRVMEWVEISRNKLN